MESRALGRFDTTGADTTGDGKVTEAERSDRPEEFYCSGAREFEGIEIAL